MYRIKKGQGSGPPGVPPPPLPALPPAYVNSYLQRLLHKSEIVQYLQNQKYLNIKSISENPNKLLRHLDLGLVMSYLRDLFFIFIFIFIMINRIAYTLVLLVIFKNISYYFWIITWMKKVNNFRKVKVRPQSFA